MLIWSVVPEEFVFEGMDTVPYNWVERDVQGVKMVVEILADNPGMGRVVRLLCPKPESYVNPAFQPGKLVNLI